MSIASAEVSIVTSLGEKKERSQGHRFTHSKSNHKTELFLQTERA